MIRCFLLFLGLVFVFSGCNESPEGIENHKKELEEIADNINSDFNTITFEVTKLAKEVEELYKHPASLKNVDKSKYVIDDKSGILYKPEDDDGSSVYVSGVIPIDNEIKNIVYLTEPLDTIFRDIIERIPEAVQVYFNDYNSVNRLYPFIDVKTQYEPKLEIPTFNFYYLANEKNNPSRGPVWIGDPYVDPAGRGWMVSAIHPVYVNDKLVGVPGIDVTINTIVERYLVDEFSKLIILDEHGVLVAAEEQSINRLYLPPLKEHKYIETIKSNQFRKDDYNLLKSKNSTIRDMADRIINHNQNEIVINLEGTKYMIIQESIVEVNWKIINLIQI